MSEEFKLEAYLTRGIEHIVIRIMRASLTNPKESLFMTKFAIATRESAKLRQLSEENGEHTPPFLIASITCKCNLHCAGCYARTNHACTDRGLENQLSDKDWMKIFLEAKELGISFILLAGGEPLLRKDVIKISGKIPEIVFPVFTNGTLFDEEYLTIFDKYRNLIPILSIEGREEKTDERRGEGIYKKLMLSMELLKKKKLLFGASVTVTSSNIIETTSEVFLNNVSDYGCRGIFYVEYVPVTVDSKKLALGDQEREYLKDKLATLREKYQDMIFISFPGDEKSSGGCLAAGRGFFHINSHGGAEPCPFSPYSDINVKETSLKEALKSKLFNRLMENNNLSEEHIGGCVLFEQKDKVEKLLLL